MMFSFCLDQLRESATYKMNGEQQYNINYSGLVYLFHTHLLAVIVISSGP